MGLRELTDQELAVEVTRREELWESVQQLLDDATSESAEEYLSQAERDAWRSLKRAELEEQARSSAHEDDFYEFAAHPNVSPERLKEIQKSLEVLDGLE